MIDTFSTRVVGLTFVPGYPNNVYRLTNIAAERFLTAPGDFMDYEGGDPEALPVVLIRNPANEHDANAIEVHVPALGDHGMIGHLPRNVSSRLAPLIDSGEKWRAEITQVAINADHPDNPGVIVKIDRV